MSTKDIFPEYTREIVKKREALAPEIMQAWRKFSRNVFKEGALDANTKQLIAIAAGHITQCPYCIRSHVRQAMKLGVKKEAIIEALWMAAAVRARAGYQHAAWSLNQINKLSGKASYDEITAKNIDEFQEQKAGLAPATDEAWQEFEAEVFKGNAISTENKWLMGLALSHITQSEVDTIYFSQKVKALNISDEVIMEAIWVASEMRAGGAMAHGALVIDEMDAVEAEMNE